MPDPVTIDAPLQREALPEQIVARLLAMIKENRLRAGDKLPPERELAAMLQVSRPSLREALRALAVLNVTEVRRGAGTYVTSLDPELLLGHLTYVLSLNDATFESLFEARKVVETVIAALAAERVDDAELAELHACVDRYAELAADSPADEGALLDADLEMHRRVVAAARNPILGRFMDSISELGKASRRTTVSLPGVTRQTAEDHRRIVAALRARDPDAASAAMLTHLDHVERRLLAVDKESEGGS